MGMNISAADTTLRQWHLLRAIPRHPRKIGVPELRTRLVADGYGVTARTLQRDLVLLSEAFPLVSDERSKPFGWSWAREAPLFDLPNLSSQEALAFAVVEAYLRPLLPTTILDGLQAHFAAAQRRLAADVASGKRRRWLDKIAVVQPTQTLLPPTIDREVQRAVSDALLNDRQLGAKYVRKGERELRGYVLNPLGLIQRGAVSYLLATAGEHDDPLFFALHRFRRVRVLDAEARRPKGFDLATYLASGAAHFGGGSVRLAALFDRAAAEHLLETPLSSDQVFTELGDGRVRITAEVQDTAQLRWWLLGFGDNVEVVHPGALRQWFAGMTANMAKRYRA